MGIPNYIKYLGVSIFCLIFFGMLQAHYGFVDPDSFYHTKIAEMMLRQGVVKDFKWLVFTVLGDCYTDHHFLYHLYLLPFIKFITPLIGVKVAAVFINSAFIVIFYLFLKSQKIKWPFFFVLLLLSGAPFIFRIDLVKASGLSLVFVMFILFALFKKKNIWLGIISFFYVWAYAGWPLGIALAAIFLFASLAANFLLDIRGPKELLKKSEWRPVLAAAFGSLAGLIINPYFPRNLYFYWIQTVQIALVNYKAKIGVGAEWYGFEITELIAYSGWIFLIILAASLFLFGRVALKKFFKPDYKMFRDTFFFMLCAGLFFVLTLKARRNSEYSFPFMVMFAGTLVRYFWDKEVFLWIKNNFLRILKFKFLYKAFAVYIILVFLFSFGANFWKIKTGMEQGFGFEKYEAAMDIAKKFSDDGDIIFHSDWDDWPMLFYHNDYNRYIVGLDTTFMYKYNKELYQRWRDITWGDYEGDAYPAVKDDFGATIIFIAENDMETMDKYFKNDSRYELLYDGEGKVYKIK